MKRWGNKIEKVIGTDAENFCVEVKFQDGPRGIVSLKHLFEKPKGLAAEVLKGEMFDKCFVEFGALAWPNGFELCPDTLKQWLFEQQHYEKKAA